MACIVRPMLLEATLVNQHSTADAKIRLFRSLFRGRDDVYPRRFESRKTGKSGYAPACGNEWIRGICEKPRIKCADCQHQRFLPITDEVIRWHLSGFDPAGQPFVAGVYPMLQDETCFFLAVDFDKEGWREDAGAFLKTCMLWAYRLCWNGPDPVMAGTCGSSSRRPSPPHLREGWVHSF